MPKSHELAPIPYLSIPLAVFECLCFLMAALLFEPPHDKTNKMTVRPAKTQISLGIRPV